MAVITGQKWLQVSKHCGIFYRSFFSNLSNNLSRHAVETEKETHIYKQSLNNRNVIDHLVKNVAFENEDWIVTNKPYGVGWERPSKKLPKYDVRTFNDVFLREILPLLAKEFNLNSLRLLFSPERFTSGVTVLAKTAEAENKFKEYHLANIKRTALQYSFMAITLFEPVPRTGEMKFKLQFNKKSKTVTVISGKKNSAGAIILCKHRLLDSSNFCSLVKVEANKLIHNSVSTYLEKGCLSPVFGEVSFNSTVSRIGNVSFPVASAEAVKNSKELDPELLSKLQLHENEVSVIPKHLHLNSLKLKLEKNEEFFVSVPPPDFFLWTCRQLNLSLNKNVS